MDNQEKLDQLFKLAREEKPLVSFEDTKAKFTACVNSSTFGERMKYLLTFKNFIIMLTSIISIAVFFMFSNSSTSEIQADENNIKGYEPENESELVVNQGKTNKKSNQVFHAEVAKIQETESSENRENRVKKRMNKIAYLDYQKAFNLFEIHPNDLLIKKGTSSSSIPVLSKEKIKENEKQKAKMLKALAKLKSEDYVFIPSGTMLYEGSTKSFQALYMQTTEVSNLEYRTFLIDLIIQGRNEEYEIAKVDTAKWVELYSEYQKVMKDLYFNHPAYNNYPVCNISRVGAEMYCSWLMEEFDKVYNFKKEVQQENKIRIPSRAEWCYAASNGKDNQVYPWGWDSVKNEKGSYVVNFRPLPGRYFDDGAFHQGICRSYIASMNALFNMSGNVAEMVYENYNSKTECGTAGGSWESDENQIKIFGPDPYKGITTPHPAIGFRVCFTYLSVHTNVATPLCETLCQNSVTSVVKNQ